MSVAKSQPEVASVTAAQIPVVAGEFAKQALFKANGIEAAVIKTKDRVSPLHAHTYTEMIYVVSGKFRDRGVEVPPGSFVVRHPGEMHEFVAEDEVTLLVVNVDQTKAA